ncbi:MAG TPA: cation transporter [bacterium]|nr:cation transporter [bacterium]HPN34747.1 cation transporter [bacterium]
MKTALFRVDGMSCHHCVLAIERELQRLPVESVQVEIGRAEIRYDEKKISESQLRDAICNAGYNVL